MGSYGHQAAQYKADHRTEAWTEFPTNSTNLSIFAHLRDFLINAYIITRVRFKPPIIFSHAKR